jgi:hypothetical protein
MRVTNGGSRYPYFRHLLTIFQAYHHQLLPVYTITVSHYEIYAYAKLKLQNSAEETNKRAIQKCELLYEKQKKCMSLDLC